MDQASVLVPFYGAELDRLTAELRLDESERVIDSSQEPEPRAVSISDAGPEPADPDPLTGDIVDRIALRAAVTDAEAATEAENVINRWTNRYAHWKGKQFRRGLHWEWVQAKANVAQRRFPWLANVGIGRFTADVQAYLTNDEVRNAVNDIVAGEVRKGPCVIVAHSLGTVVAYRLLAETQADPDVDVPLLVTLGSPLGIDVIRNRLAPPALGFPAKVGKWLNAADPRDFVALSERLDAQTFIDGIDNIVDISNQFDPHDIRGYLSDERVAKGIHDAMT